MIVGEEQEEDPTNFNFFSSYSGPIFMKWILFPTTVKMADSFLSVSPVFMNICIQINNLLLRAKNIHASRLNGIQF